MKIRVRVAYVQAFSFPLRYKSKYLCVNIEKKCKVTTVCPEVCIILFNLHIDRQKRVVISI